MKLLFIDETQNNKNRDFYGICGICIDSTHYASFCRTMSGVLSEYKWDSNYEFKGNIIFSISKGDPDIDVEKRLEMASKILSANIANTNAKLKAVFAHNNKGGNTSNHCELIKLVIGRLLAANPTGKSGKNLCTVHIDQNDKVSHNELFDTINPLLQRKGFILVEDLHIIKNWNISHAGLCLCDLIAYIGCWVCLWPDETQVRQSILDDKTISHDAIKLSKVKDILSAIKNIEFIPKLESK